MKIFENYLQEIHAKGYAGTDDDMPDAFERWLSELDTNDVIQYAEQAIEKWYKLSDNAINELKKIRDMATDFSEYGDNAGTIINALNNND